MNATLKLGELAKGSTRLADLLAEGQSSVRSDPANAKRRVMLFQLMVLSGQWDRALTQLYVIKEMDPEADDSCAPTAKSSAASCSARRCSRAARRRSCWASRRSGSPG